MPPTEVGGKWGTECLYTKFPLPTLLCMGYSVKLMKYLIKNNNNLLIIFYSFPNYGSPISSYGYNNPPLNSNMNMQPQPPQYDVSADYVDSTTAYEPKQSGGFLDTDFIGHGECCVFTQPPKYSPNDIYSLCDPK